MDYEQKYKEALEKAKKEWSSNLYNAYKNYRERLEIIFPELKEKESEDDRTRKAILTGLIDCRDAPDLGWSDFGGVNIDECIAWIEKQGEQTHAAPGQPEVTNTSVQELEPKFHEGDWIVDKSGLAQQVLSIRGGIYTCTYNSFTTDCESNYHLWTIQDAKDGDVLVTKEDGRPFIFNGLLDKSHPESPVAYCGIDDDDDFFVSISGDKWWTGKEVCPSTKEQRDLLFQKMNDAGYEWDADKKKLKKKSQRMISAEAKEALYNKPAWKPSDEQMDALHYVFQHYTPNATDRLAWDSVITLELMYRDLKKLRGE